MSTEKLNTTAPVQPILLPPDAKRFPLSTVLAAAGTASAAALVAADRSDPLWARWLEGRFRKSVRVAKSRTDFDTAQQLSEHCVSGDGFTAVGFAPTTYPQMPHWMARARVEGLHCADDLATEPSAGQWAIGVVAEMSAGKAAAQVAHALCMLVLQTGSLPSFSIYRADPDAHGDVEVVDAGFTEFDRPTRTVIASQR